MKTWIKVGGTKSKTDNQKRRTDPNTVNNLKGSGKCTKCAHAEKGKGATKQWEELCSSQGPCLRVHVTLPVHSGHSLTQAGQTGEGLKIPKLVQKLPLRISCSWACSCSGQLKKTKPVPVSQHGPPSEFTLAANAGWWERTKVTRGRDLRWREKKQHFLQLQKMFVLAPSSMAHAFHRDIYLTALFWVLIQMDLVKTTQISAQKKDDLPRCDI